MASPTLASIKEESRQQHLEWLSQMNVEELAFNEKRERLNRELEKWRNSRLRCQEFRFVLYDTGYYSLRQINKLLNEMSNSLEEINKEFAQKVEMAELKKYKEFCSSP